MLSFLDTRKIASVFPAVLMACALLPHAAFSQPLRPGLQSPPQAPANGMQMQPPPAPDPSQLASHIGAISAKDAQSAGDFAQMAQLTIDFGVPQKEQGQLPDPRLILDAIEAVTVGEKLNALAADWGNLREELYKLLEEPPQQDQQNQDQQNEDQENQENDSENQESQDQDGNQEPQDGENQQNQDSQDGQSGDQQSDDQQQQDGQEGEDSQSQQSQSLGEMDTPDEPIEVDPEQQQSQQPQPAPTEQIGGAEQTDRTQDPQQARAYQLLDKVKQQDQPSRFFQLMQSDEAGEPQETPQKKQKDW